MKTTQIAPEDQLKIVDDVIQKMNALQDFSPTIGPRKYEKAKENLEQKHQEASGERTQIAGSAS